MWPDRRIIDLFGIEHPILLAPMAGPGTAELAIAVAEAGGLGALALRDVEPGADPQGSRRDPPAHGEADQPELLHPHAAAPDPAREARWKARLAAYYAGARHRSGQTRARRQPRALRRNDLRHRRGIQAGDRQLPFRPAGATAAGARAGRRLQGDRVGDHGGRGEVAGRARLRCDHRAGRRGRRPSRHVPHRRRRLPGRHLRAGAAGGRCGQGARDRRRRHRRCARHRGRPGARRGGRADRHGLSVLPGGQRPGIAPAGAAQRAR